MTSRPQTGPGYVGLPLLDRQWHRPHSSAHRSTAARCRDAVDLKALYGGTGSQYCRGISPSISAAARCIGPIRRRDAFTAPISNGSNVETLLSGFTGGALRGIEIDPAAGKMYWTDSVAQKIQRANLDGSGVQDLVTAHEPACGSVTLDLAAGKMYWGDYERQQHPPRNLDGTGVELLWTGAAGPPTRRAIAFDPCAGKMYWSDSSARTDPAGQPQRSMRGNSWSTYRAFYAESTVASLERRSPGRQDLFLRLRSIRRSTVPISTALIQWRSSSTGLPLPKESAIVIPAVTVTPNTGLVTSESGGSATFKVALTTPPTANVTFRSVPAIHSREPSRPPASTFTPANWNVPQTVTVTGVDDAVLDGNMSYNDRAGRRHERRPRLRRPESAQTSRSPTSTTR